MHCKHGIGGLLGKLSWLIVSLAAINVGLVAAGVWHFGELGFIANNPRLMMICAYVVGIAGVISLLGLLTAGYHCMSGTCPDCKPNHR